MRGGIDAFGQTAGDGEAGLRQLTGEAPGVVAAARARTATADDGDLGAGEQFHVPFDKKNRGRAGAVSQQGRVVVLVPGDQAPIRLGEPGEIGIDAPPVHGTTAAIPVHGRQQARRIAVLFQRGALECARQSAAYEFEQGRGVFHTPESIAAPEGAAM